MNSNPARQIPLQETPATARRVVLQIEDNPANAEVVRQLLARRSDLSLHTVDNGRQGIEMALLLQPAVILLDMMMPGMSGLEVMPILAQQPSTANIPVIALSSNAYPTEIEKCMDAGAFAYLTKPYRLDSLLGAIDAALLRR